MTYVRVESRRYELVYHRDTCRHVAGHRFRRNPMEPVSAAEVQKAIDAGRFKRVEFKGRTVALNVCLSCFPPAPTWPPDGV